MTINLIYIAAVMLGLGLLIAALSVSVSGGEPRGVARSLMLIDQQVERREVVTSDLAAKDRLVAPILQHTKGLARALSPGGVDQRYTMMLDQAGNPTGWTVERILGAKGAALLVGLVLGAFYGKFQLPNSLLFAVIGGAALFFLPDLLIKNVAQRRQEQTSKSLADALDMLSVCVEAGQGVDAAPLPGGPNADGPIPGGVARGLSRNPNSK